MLINDLPDDVLALVFRAVLQATKYQLADAKDGLELLAVCRRWHEIARPLVYNTVFIECGTLQHSIYNRPECVNIATTLDHVVGAKCLPMVRRLVVDVRYQDDPFPGLKAVISRMQGAADKWSSVRKLEVRLHTGDWDDDRNYIERDRQEDIDSVSSELSALLPGLREIRIDYPTQTQAISTVFGQLVGSYANQLRVLHSEQPLVVPQDCVFAQLRDVMIDGYLAADENYQPPRLNPGAIESLVLGYFTANDMWSMFCADVGGHAVTFPRLRNLRLKYCRTSWRNPRQPRDERPWALQFPAAKHVRIVCSDAVCPSMENAVFPTHLESLDISADLGLLQAISRAKIQVSQNLTINFWHSSAEDDIKINTSNRTFTAAGPCKSKRLEIGNQTTIPCELFTYTGLTHLNLRGSASVDDVVKHIRAQPHLVSLAAAGLCLGDTQTDFAIPMCAEHEPVAHLHTQIRELKISVGRGPLQSKLAIPMLKYLLLRIPTLRKLVASKVSPKPILEFIDKYTQWYPHLANVEFSTS